MPARPQLLNKLHTFKSIQATGVGISGRMLKWRSAVPQNHHHVAASPLPPLMLATRNAQRCIPWSAAPLLSAPAGCATPLLSAAARAARRSSLALSHSSSNLRIRVSSTFCSGSHES